MIKVCSKCNKEYPATREYFYCDKRHKDGLRPECKECRKQVCYKYYQQRSEKLKKQQIEYYQKMRNTIKGYLRIVYANMNQRCNNQNHPRYKDYGGRDIKNKFNSSDEFVDYVINELQIDPRGLTIDRIDNNGDYEKGNIRFITAKENCNNRRKRGKNENSR